MSSEPAGSSPDGLPPLGHVVRSLQLSARKGLGQHFILDLNVTRRISRAAGPLAGKTVVEIGPGPGGLTRALLLEGAERVIAVERDERCRPALEAIAARYPGRLDVHFCDALEADWCKLVAGATPSRSSSPICPTTWRRYCSSAGSKPRPGRRGTGTWCLMFQKEVAERVVAAPATKAYGRLAVMTQWRTRARLLFTLRPEAFTPAAGGRFRGGRVQADRAATAGMLGSNAGQGHCRGLRPAPQDAAPEPQAARRRARSTARGDRPRADLARRGADGERLRSAGLRARALADALTILTGLPAHCRQRPRARSDARASGAPPPGWQ